MKKLIFLLLLLITTPCFGQDFARMNLGVVGGGVPAGSDYTEEETGDLTPNADRYFGYTTIRAGSNRQATKSYTLTKLTLFLKKVGAPDYLITGKIWSAWPHGTELGASTNTISTVDLTTSYAQYEFLFDGVSISSGTTYLFGVSAPNSGSAGNYAVFGYDSEGTQWTDYYAASWSVIDYTTTACLRAYSGGP